jgi:hypothetical protein
MGRGAVEGLDLNLWDYSINVVKIMYGEFFVLQVVSHS